MVSRHGIVVVHGQADGLVLGDQLAVVANAIADALENAGGRVAREFTVAEGRATGRLTVTKPGEQAAGDEFDFVEGYWAQSLPVAPAEAVAKWMLRLEIVSIGRAFGSHDGKEARQAFLEKRTPVFEGR